MTGTNEAIHRVVQEAFPNADVSMRRGGSYSHTQYESSAVQVTRSGVSVLIGAEVSQVPGFPGSAEIKVSSVISGERLRRREAVAFRKNVILKDTGSLDERALCEIIAQAKWTAAASLVVREYVPSGVVVQQAAYRLDPSSEDPDFMVRLMWEPPTGGRVINTVRAKVGAGLTCSPYFDDVAKISVPSNEGENYPSLFASEQIRDFFL